MAAQFFYSLPPFLTAVLLAFTALTAMGPGRQAPGSRLLALLCFLGSLLYIDIMINFNASADVALTTSRIAHLLYPFLLPLFVQFFHSLLAIHHRGIVEKGAYGYALLIASFSAGGWIIEGNRRFAFGHFGQAGPLFFLLAAGAAAATIYNGVIIYQAIRSEKRTIQRNKLKYIFFGFGLLGALSSLNCLTALGVPLYPPGNFGFIPLLVFAAGVFRYDLLDMGVLLRKTLLYTLLVGFLIAAYLLTIIPLQRAFEPLGWNESPLFPLVLLILLAIAAGSLKARLSAPIERWLSRERFDFRRTLRHVSQRIATVQDHAKIALLLREIIIDVMKVKSCALFLVGPADGCCRAVATAGAAAVSAGDTMALNAQLVRCLGSSGGRSLLKQQLLSSAGAPQTELLRELEAVGAEIVLPMRFQHELKGFLILGEKRSGKMYDSEDLDLLEPLCHQSAVAIQNALSFQFIKELNKTLEQKVDERTRDLQTALAEKERSQEQMIRSESLASLGQLVAGVAHELNNPLTSVTSLLQSVVEEIQQENPQCPADLAGVLDDLQFADKELARAKAIVTSLLGLSRQTQTYEETVDLNSIVSDTLRLLPNLFKNRLPVIIEDLDAGLPPIKGNFAQLTQAVRNVVQNAVQAVDPQTGRICLSTRHSPETRRVVLICRDNGPGIEPGLRHDVFKPFFTTKPVGQGTGLGLYICHRIIEKHHGSIELASAEPCGAVLIIKLPSVLSQAERP